MWQNINEDRTSKTENVPGSLKWGKKQEKDTVNLGIENMISIPNEKKEVHSSLTTIIGLVCRNEGKAEVSC